MKFLLDTHLPPRLVKEFTTRGHECLQVRTLLTPDTADTVIAAKANEIAAVMVTKDEDFFHLKKRGVLKTPLVWLRMGNVTSVHLCDGLGPRIPEICAALEAGQTIVEIR